MLWKKKYKKILRRKVLYFCLIFGFTCANGIITITNYIPGLMTKDLKYGEATATTIVLLVGIANMVGRFGSGCIGMIGVEARCGCFLLTLILGGIAHLIIPFWNAYTMLVIHAFTTGIASGTYDRYKWFSMHAVIIQIIILFKHIHHLIYIYIVALLISSYYYYNIIICFLCMQLLFRL